MISVFEGYKHLLGPVHKHTLIALQNLADIYKRNEEHDIAVKIYKELLTVLEDDKNEHEIDFNQILTIKGRLALSLSTISEFEQAIKLITELVLIFILEPLKNWKINFLKKIELGLIFILLKD